jgi:hypothetical protein
MGHHSGIPHLWNNAAKTSLQLSRREMLALSSILLGPKALAAEAQAYDILGLQLNMTAAEAQQILAQRLHAKPKQDGYRIFAGNPQYVPNRPYTTAISFEPLGPNSGGWKAPELNLGLNFAEVYPGEGKGPETLWNIEYEPRLDSEASKKDFVQSVIDKFGKPTANVFNSEYIWADKDYGSELAFDSANVPVLRLTPAGNPRLKLSNPGIRTRMEKIYNSQRSKKVTPF